ncbi:MAG: helix-turn-helix transcriptional regulator [Rikenellaceae bacterium]
MNRTVPVIVILTPNTLMSMGLRSMLEGMLPFGVYKVCSEFEEISDSEPEDFFHLFVSANIVVEHGPFFEARRHKTIILTQGGVNSNVLQGFHQINIMASQGEIETAIKKMHHSAHGSHGSHGSHGPHGSAPHHPHHMHAAPEGEKDVLSPREIEVTKLLVEGLINKEIASRLSISLTTVITHRKNIFEKLGIKSVAGLTIYAVMKGYLEI